MKIRYLIVAISITSVFLLPLGCGLFDGGGSSGGLGPLGPVIVPYQDDSFTVEPFSKMTITINMRAGAVLEGYLTVRGGNDDIRFYIEDSYGTMLLDKNRVQGRFDFSFTASTAGFHTMFFDNSFSWITSKQVFIHYRVR